MEDAELKLCCVKISTTTSPAGRAPIRVFFKRVQRPEINDIPARSCSFFVCASPLPASVAVLQAHRRVLLGRRTNRLLAVYKLVRRTGKLLASFLYRLKLDFISVGPHRVVGAAHLEVIFWIIWPPCDV